MERNVEKEKYERKGEARGKQEEKEVRRRGGGKGNWSGWQDAACRERRKKGRER